MKNILMEEVNRHPEMELTDLYKFIHQSAFGSEHAVKDTIRVKEWMQTEIAGLDFSLKDSLIEPLSPDGQMVRINLRPWIIAGFEIEVLLNAFIQTANYHNPSRERFMEYWECARELAKNNEFNFPVKEMDKFYKLREKQGFPAIHHSKLYEEKYCPAYRVIDRQFLEGRY